MIDRTGIQALDNGEYPDAPLSQESKMEFVDRIMKYHGFAGNPFMRTKLEVPKNDYALPEVSIHELTHERFKDQGRQHLLRNTAEWIAENVKYREGAEE